MNTRNRRIQIKSWGLLLFAIITSLSVFSQQRLMEKLNRGVVAVKTEDGNFLSWRKFATDSNDVTFNLYRDGALVNQAPFSTVSNFLDKNGADSSYYYIEVLKAGVAVSKTNTVLVWTNGYKEIPLQTPDGYKPNDVSIADLDGDGEFEIVVKMMGVSKDNSQAGVTDPVFLQAYEMNGRLIWSINLGINIRAGSHYNPFMVYDLDGDGKAELACKTAPGTKDATGTYLSNGPAATDHDLADYRDKNGYILDGPEYLTLFEGTTGKEISTVEYVPLRGVVGDWGDTYGNRVDRFLACVAYFDTVPSLVMTRGYYTRSVLVAWDYKDGGLVQRWVFDSDVAGSGVDGNANSTYAGQGAHSLSVGDVDQDGKDEIVYGAMTIDHDGKGLWNTGNNHGDATHLGDFLPDREGLEYWMPSETGYSINKITGEKIPGVWLADAATGETIWQVDITAKNDVGRGMTANITDDYEGNEFWAYGQGGLKLGVYNSDGDIISDLIPSNNFGLWWDGDLTREMLSDTKVYKWSPTDYATIVDVSDDCLSNNSTKATPNLSGDIIGDWREEVIWRTADNKSLRIYTTTDTTQFGLNTLLQDPQYRLALTWQNTGYNQPPHPSFFVGSDMAQPEVPSIKMIEPNVGASIEIASPNNNLNLELGNSLSVSLNLSQISDTTVVYLSNGGSLLDSINGAPYISKLDTLKTGNYELIAWCYDANLNKIESSPIHMYVDKGYPHVLLTSPENGIAFGSNDSILLSADAYDSDGNIDNVTFYFNNEAIASITEEPYSVKVKNPGYGVYDIIAIASDNNSFKDTSDTHTISVGETTIIQENEIGFCGFLIKGFVENNHEDYTGDGFANTSNLVGGGLSWAINIEAAGKYKFYWRYSSGDSRPAKFSINDTIGVSVLDFSDTEGSWEVWQLQESSEVDLIEGEYEVKLAGTSEKGLGNIDYMSILAFGETRAQKLECDSLGEVVPTKPNTTGLKEELSISDNINIYPLPASNVLNIEMMSGEAIINEVKVIDISGKQLMSVETLSKRVQLDIQALESGIYMLNINSSLGMCVKKFVVN